MNDTDWEAIARGNDEKLKVIGKIIRELSERISEASYLSHEQRYKVSSEIDEFIRGVGL